MNKNIHERGSSLTGMKTIFRENIHERGSSPTGMKTIFREKRLSSILLKQPLFLY